MSLHPEIPGPLEAEVGPGHGVQGPGLREQGTLSPEPSFHFCHGDHRPGPRVASFLLCQLEPEEVLGHTESGVRGPPAERVAK